MKAEIETAEGVCPSHVYHPQGAGPWPGVILYMDGIGMRPALLEVGERLGDSGYFVLVPDLFYRSGPYEPMDAMTLFSDPEKRKLLNEKFFSRVTRDGLMNDTRSFLAYLRARSEVKPGKIGTTGYCFGGRVSLWAASAFPNEIAATACYHGGNLATDAADSPHLGARDIQSRVYVAGATDDSSFPEEQRARLERALSEAGVDHEIETYPARHGWVFRDTPAYNLEASDRHWRTLLALFAETLGK